MAARAQHVPRGPASGAGPALHSENQDAPVQPDPNDAQYLNIYNELRRPNLTFAQARQLSIMLFTLLLQEAGPYRGRCCNPANHDHACTIAKMVKVVWWPLTLPMAEAMLSELSVDFPGWDAIGKNLRQRSELKTLFNKYFGTLVECFPGKWSSGNAKNVEFLDWLNYLRDFARVVVAVKATSGARTDVSRREYCPINMACLAFDKLVSLLAPVAVPIDDEEQDVQPGTPSVEETLSQSVATDDDPFSAATAPSAMDTEQTPTETSDATAEASLETQPSSSRVRPRDDGAERVAPTPAVDRNVRSRTVDDTPMTMDYNSEHINSLPVFQLTTAQDAHVLASPVDTSLVDHAAAAAPVDPLFLQLLETGIEFDKEFILSRVYFGDTLLLVDRSLPVAEEPIVQLPDAARPSQQEQQPSSPEEEQQDEEQVNDIEFSANSWDAFIYSLEVDDNRNLIIRVCK